MLQTYQLTKRYEDNQLALDTLNLEIKPGQIFFLLGANGAGKTTTINLFLNFITPTMGSADINHIKNFFKFYMLSIGNDRPKLL